jgi:hypothetical protein
MKLNTLAYLDLLAFSNHVRENTTDALMAFENYRTILEQKIKDALVHPPETYPSAELQRLAERDAVNSFNYFLPFSDSVFIASNNPNLFLKQLGAFILHCFLITSREYENPEDMNNPTKVTIPSIGKDVDGNLAVSKVEVNWYPTLFRGGVALGEVIPISLMGIVENKPTPISNLAGKAVVKAVGLESKIKGPRIIFEKDLYDELSADTKIYVIETEVEGIYELLWTAFLYIPGNGITDLNDTRKLFVPAVNLWRANKDTKYAEHYFKFVELVVSGTIRFFDAHGSKDAAIHRVRELIKSVGLEDKIKI